MDNKDNAGNNLVNPDDINTNNDVINENNINDIDFQNPVHQFENLQPLPEPEYKKYTKMGIIVVVVIIALLILILIINSIIKSNQDKVCIPIEDKIIKAAVDYAKNKNTLPINEGEFVVIELDDLYSENALKQSDATVKEDVCNGNIKITKYKDEYIKTINLTNCGYCTTEKRYKKKIKEDTNKPAGKNMVVDVTAYYNYSTYEDYNTNWTTYLNTSLISEEVSKKYGVALPLEQRYLPTVPEEAKILRIEKEDKQYYRFRDKRWKYYVDRGGVYTTEFYSEQPAGYANKDNDTVKLNEWSEWSLNYPDTKDYRTIRSSVGYKWYYKKGREKKYWNGGAYSVEQPSEKYNIKDNETNVKMYSYQDRTWLWYNGTKRSYSGFYSVTPNGFNLKDESLFQYSGWSNWTDISYLNNSNSAYREQETTTYSRYRIQYRMNSYFKLEDHLTLKEFEKETNVSLTEFLTKEKTEVDIKYKFKYRKR